MSSVDIMLEFRNSASLFAERNAGRSCVSATVIMPRDVRCRIGGEAFRCWFSSIVRGFCDDRLFRDLAQHLPRFGILYASSRKQQLS